MASTSRISIWFFIGLILLIYGITIFAAGIYELFDPSFGSGVVLYQLHSGIWWGALLIILGLIYLIKFKPGKVK
jgi:hypothetical protein